MPIPLHKAAGVDRTAPAKTNNEAGLVSGKAPAPNEVVKISEERAELIKLFRPFTATACPKDQAGQNHHPQSHNHQRPRQTREHVCLPFSVRMPHIGVKIVGTPGNGSRFRQIATSAPRAAITLAATEAPAPSDATRDSPDRNAARKPALKLSPAAVVSTISLTGGGV